jgi:hypothetical protein
MTRRYDAVVDVRKADDLPDAFLWQGRLYSVRAVLAHWMEAGAWWSQAVPDGGCGRGLDDREREVWRVEARPGRSGGIGVFDLCFDWSTGGWTLARAHD